MNITKKMIGITGKVTTDRELKMSEEVTLSVKGIVVGIADTNNGVRTYKVKAGGIEVK